MKRCNHATYNLRVYRDLPGTEWRYCDKCDVRKQFRKMRSGKIRIMDVLTGRPSASMVNVPEWPAKWTKEAIWAKR